MTSKVLGTALGVSVAGGALLLLALRARWVPGDLNPGIEGCLTASILGFVMALLHPMSYARALGLSVLPTAALYVLCVYAGGVATGLGMAGIQLLVMGFTGVAFGLRDERRDPARRGEPTRARHGRPAHSHA
jgi:hypothetical protein